MGLIILIKFQPMIKREKFSYAVGGTGYRSQSLCRSLFISVCGTRSRYRLQDVSEFCQRFILTITPKSIAYDETIKDSV